MSEIQEIAVTTHQQPHHPDETITAELTYLGRRTLSTGKIGYAYTSAGETTRYYKTPLVTGADIGALITIHSPADDPNVYYSAGMHKPRLTGFDSTVDAATLTAWQAADRAAYQVKADEDAARRAAKQAAHVDHHITALADAARGLTGQQRAAFARYVEDRIRGW